jgi:hypothetical protein
VRSFFSAATSSFLTAFAVVEAGAQRVGLGVVLVQDVEVQGLGPPVVQLGGGEDRHRVFLAIDRTAGKAGCASAQLIWVGLAPSAVKVSRNSGEPTTRIFSP